ncbi:YncE family protein [Pelagibacterium lacus]|uniref:YncE family protein n=1 Tax=Pelagibacterium lacus TaxID=2282655 RepID=A0A369W3F9_9HYPH|nr:hypothetical protein [Pelagibacterium lacus]RDE08579.1 hypothetical protein DVH29_10475 [Pelagibacterium lacus]
MTLIASSTARRLRTAALVIAGAGLLAPAAFAQEVAESGWAYTVERIATGVNNGYQLAFDSEGRQVYFADTRWRSEARDADGNVAVTQRATGKVVQFDAETRAISDIYSYLGLSRSDGNGTEGDAFDWTGVDAESLSSMRSHFSPYGIAVDYNGGDPLVITTTARGRDAELGYGGHVVVFNPAQGDPTDADRIWQLEDGSPVFDGVRRVAVNTETHKAFVTNFADARGDKTRPGFVVVIDLPTRTVEARVAIPEGGAIGLAVDEERNLVYVGSLVGENLYVIDAGALDTSAPADLELNADAVTLLPASVPENARPTYSPELQRLYISSYASPEGTITVVDADTDSASYGEVIDTIATGPTNSVAVDGERGLLYSANLGDREVVVYDAESFEELHRLPTTGNALNVGIDPATGDAWVSNFSQASVTDVFTLTYVGE